MVRELKSRNEIRNVGKRNDFYFKFLPVLDSPVYLHMSLILSCEAYFWALLLQKESITRKSSRTHPVSSNNIWILSAVNDVEMCMY